MNDDDVGLDGEIWETPSALGVELRSRSGVSNEQSEMKKVSDWEDWRGTLLHPRQRSGFVYFASHIQNRSTFRRASLSRTIE